MMTAAIGTAIRERRTALGMSRDALAAAVGVSVRLVSEVERGERPNVSLESTLRLLRALGLTLIPTMDAPSVDVSETAEDAKRRAREERAARRRATWTGETRALGDEVPPAPPATVVERLAAVSAASALANALAAQGGGAKTRRK